MGGLPVGTGNRGKSLRKARHGETVSRPRGKKASKQGMAVFKTVAAQRAHLGTRPMSLTLQKVCNAALQCLSLGVPRLGCLQEPRRLQAAAPCQRATIA